MGDIRYRIGRLLFVAFAEFFRAIGLGSDLL